MVIPLVRCWAEECPFFTIVFPALAVLLPPNNKYIIRMKLNAGIITEKLAESKAFYTQVLQFGVTFENDFYLLLHTPNHEAEISFLLPNHPSQQPLFQKPFTQQGV